MPVEHNLITEDAKGSRSIRCLDIRVARERRKGKGEESESTNSEKDTSQGSLNDNIHQNSHSSSVKPTLYTKHPQFSAPLSQNAKDSIVRSLSRHGQILKDPKNLVSEHWKEKSPIVLDNESSKLPPFDDPSNASDSKQFKLKKLSEFKLPKPED